MIHINRNIVVPESELEFHAIRSSGPGGQNVNKVATAVQLRFNVATSSSLSEDVRRRLLKLAGRKVNSEGVLIIDARRFRTQKQNQADAIERFKNLINLAAIKPKPRRKTRPTAGSIQRRLEQKKFQSRKKQLRRPADD